MIRPATIRKAHRLPVVRAHDGTFRVGGDTDVYTVYRSHFQSGWVCNCFAARTNRCSHVVAVELATEREPANG